MAEEEKKPGKPDKVEKHHYVERSLSINVTYLEQFKELVSDLSIEVKKNFDIKKKEFLVKPRAPGSYPAILVLHDWWGIDDYVRMVCMRFAKENYVVLAPSLYEGEVTGRPDVARHLMKSLKVENGMELVEQYYEQLAQMPSVDPNRIAVVGFLMGGFYSLVAAAKFKKIAAAVSFYGKFPQSLYREIPLIQCPVLLFAGGLKDWLEQEEVEEIRKTLTEHQIKSAVFKYDHVDPAFFDDLHLDTYDFVTSEDSWRLMVQFLNEHMKKKKIVLHPKLRHYFGKFGGKILDRVEESGLGGKMLDVFEDAMDEKKSPETKEEKKE